MHPVNSRLGPGLFPRAKVIVGVLFNSSELPRKGIRKLSEVPSEPNDARRRYDEEEDNAADDGKVHLRRSPIEVKLG
jgi:hypothetical protein